MPRPFTEGEKDLGVLQWSEGCESLPTVDDNNRSRGEKEVELSRSSSAIESGGLFFSKEYLEQIIGENDKDNLVENEGECARSEFGQIPEAFELAVALFNGGTEWRIRCGVGLPRCLQSGVWYREASRRLRGRHRRIPC